MVDHLECSACDVNISSSCDCRRSMRGQSTKELIREHEDNYVLTYYWLYVHFVGGFVGGTTVKYALRPAVWSLG